MQLQRRRIARDSGVVSALHRQGVPIADNILMRNSRRRMWAKNTRVGGHVGCGSNVQEPVTTLPLFELRDKMLRAE